MKNSAYKTAKNWYITWLLEECDDPYGEISHIIDNLSDEQVNDLLTTFQEDMENNNKPIPSKLKL